MKVHLIKTTLAVKLIGLVALSTIFASTPGLAQEIIVDNRDANTRQIGFWWPSSGPNPYLGDSLYNQNRDGSFTWFPVLPKAGDYEVYAWWTYHPVRAASVPYRIKHDGGTFLAYVNQRDPDLGGQWNMLGTYTFSAGVVPEISLFGKDGNMSADAVRFVLTGSPEPPPSSGLSGWSRQSITCPNRSPGTPAGEWYYCDRRCLPAGTRILGGGGDYAQVHSVPGVQPTGPVEWEMISSAPIADDLWRTVWRANTVTTVNFAATTYALCATEAAPP